MKKSLWSSIVFSTVFLVAVANAASPDFNPETYSAKKRAELAQSLAMTNDWLEASGKEVAQGWRKFLQWNETVSELQKKSPNLGLLHDILNKWRKNKVGLDDPKFVASQRALREFIRAEEIRLQGDFKVTSEAWQSELGERLKSGEGRDNVDRIARLLGWLELTGQSPELVNQTRAKWSKPNMQLHLSSKLLAYGLDGTKIDNKQYASAVIMGMTTGGMAETKGTVTAVPVASNRNGVGIIELQFSAKIYSPHNYGSKGPVGVHSTSNTTGYVTKRLIFSGDGITSERSRAWANVASQVTQIDAGPIVGWFASRKIRRSKGQAEYEAAVIAAGRLAQQFDEQVETQLKKMKEEQTAKMKRTLEFEGTYPSRLAFASNGAGLVMQAVEANKFQLAADTVAPAPGKDTDLSALVHESFATNFLESYLGNKFEHDTSWYDIHKLLTMEEPLDLRVHDRAPRWYLRMTEWSPMVTRFADGVIVFRIHGREISEEQNFKQAKVVRPVMVRVTYKPVIEAGQALGERVGEVEVQYTDGKNEDSTSAALKTMLHRKMSAFFPERFELGGLSIPKGSGWEKFDKLKAQRIDTKDGWLTSDYKLEF